MQMNFSTDKANCGSFLLSQGLLTSVHAGCLWDLLRRCEGLGIGAPCPARSEESQRVCTSCKDGDAIDAEVEGLPRGISGEGFRAPLTHQLNGTQAHIAHQRAVGGAVRG